jgi:hypothetical protein
VDGCRQPRKTLRPDPYSPHADSFGFPSTKQEGTDTGHHEKVEIHRPNCLTRAVTWRARRGRIYYVFWGVPLIRVFRLTVNYVMRYPGLERHLRITATPLQPTIMPSNNYRNQAKDSSGIAFSPGSSHLALSFCPTSFSGEFPSTSHLLLSTALPPCLLSSYQMNSCVVLVDI